MNHEKLDSMYQSIAGLIISAIPEEWSKLFIYGELQDDVQSSYFFYCPENESGKYIQIFDIPDLFEVDNDFIDQIHEQLDDKLFSLWNEFKQNDNEPWTTFNMSVDSNGKLKVNFGYKDLSNTSHHDRMIVWQYENLGLVPTRESDKEVLQKHLNLN
ncbi:immunity protein YezG family protein [Marininema halotolerans]|uniref:Antitoxin YezG n=1 Tax=Marininema halotolerans TaxID=1155944 RepID=A0A1I6QJ47_9BACL|nr:immunity protein YezG family protein [Marininema halotolerans]SFS52471.1 conserved hypothetical protein [Marininema halotolerans]